MRTDTITRIAAVCIMFLVTIAGSIGYSARIKDIASVGGVRDNQLVGYGLVVGLNGTGDSLKNGFTNQTLANMLSRQGLSMREKNLKSDNVAAVMVTAKLPPFAKTGNRIDVMVSSIGDAESLLGGTLLMTPLRGADGRIYAVAQGSVTVGGFSAGGSGGGVTKNHTTTGQISNGASVERELQYDFIDRKEFCINLHQPDFTTTRGVAETINTAFQEQVHAELIDSSSVKVIMADAFQGNIVNLVSAIENLNVYVDSKAVVVLNEKTGTVVMGEKVRISTVAIAHGNLSIQIREDKQVSQPLPFSPAPPSRSVPTQLEGGVTVAPGGQTVVTTETTVNAFEEKKQLMVVSEGVTIQEVVNALNAIGVSPRDLIVILQTIKAAGALQADLKIM